MVSKVGKETASIVPKFPPLYSSPQVMSKAYKERVVEVLKEAKRPLNIEEIRRTAGIGAWATARNAINVLLAEGKIEIAFKLKAMQFYKIKEGS